MEEDAGVSVTAEAEVEVGVSLGVGAVPETELAAIDAEEAAALSKLEDEEISCALFRASVAISFAALASVPLLSGTIVSKTWACASIDAWKLTPMSAASDGDACST